MFKKSWVLVWLLFLLSGVFALFWYNDWKYQLPTPIPKNFKQVDIGQVIDFKELGSRNSGKPTFLHFFNPECPCSRFNIKQFQALVRQYGQQVNFMVVVMSTKTYTARAIQEKFDLNIPVVFDSKVAGLCGVYSTPQAVLLGVGRQLYYRGNYNRSRYCTDEKTSYAKIALNGLLQHNSGLSFDQFALTSYGCSLPYCKN
ncbi:TlpA family protein disulfide reductase [Dyadobacter frigoris]|uniref:Redoxin domain-containing protein n=1 Tax=Dyadobacter frigoris TaxID=2576211 RepID=A0A4U6CR56_9BACT|nr:redoxin domain-containing protein [Dyadobacter frigoris]TKT87020.1 redoxin domain-containing protein [Dyadobacter frigoris]